MPKATPLLEVKDAGLYCAAGDFYIDPWRKVNRAVTTHAHSDHAKPGSGYYLCSAESLHVLRARLGNSAHIETLKYGESITIGNVKLSLHPAGHILGSAQVRIEYKGEVWVVSGDYKREADTVCTPFEPVKCHTFITESTFGMPVFNWPRPETVFADINHWWASESNLGRNCMISAYSLGKAQRILSGLNPDIGPIYVHPAVQAINEAYTHSGIQLPQCSSAAAQTHRGILMIMPPGTMNASLQQVFGEPATAFASGWMAIRSMRKRNPVDRGFVLSDHADWKGLLQTIQEVQPERVLVTHGYISALVRYLNESGIASDALRTQFTGDSEA